MRKILITAPTFKPLEMSLVLQRPEIRGLAGDSDKLLIADFMTSAIEAYQEYTENILCLSTWDLYLDGFPSKSIDTPGPLETVTGITYEDSSGSSQTLSASNYIVDVSNPNAGRISLVSGVSWPVTTDEANSVIVRLTAGYANAGSIPATIRDWLVAYIMAMMSGNMAAVDYLRLNNYRRWYV
jgi:uncharacterized phiE125 gp8 family phage protein